MPKHRLLLACTAVGLSVCASTAAGAQSLNVSGVWQGVNYASQAPGPHKVVLTLNQSGAVVSGTFWVATGVYGAGQGQVTGPTSMTIDWVNTSPSCPGSYHNVYVVSGNRMTWTFTGYDCLGPETGYGNATRTVRLEKRTMSK